MALSVLVSNEPPDTDSNVPHPLLDLFRAYVGKSYAPFQHQAEVFRLLTEDKEIFLVAGAAARKSLAIAVPLFNKLATRRIRKGLVRGRARKRPINAWCRAMRSKWESR